MSRTPTATWDIARTAILTPRRSGPAPAPGPGRSCYAVGPGPAGGGRSSAGPKVRPDRRDRRRSRIGAMDDGGPERAPSPAPPLSLDDLLVLLVDRTRMAFLQRLERHRLSMPQAFTLRLLDRPQPMRCLADAMRCDASNLTGIADRLEERGLVERRIDPRDRRVKLLAITPKGHRLRVSLHDGLWTDLPGASRLCPGQREQLVSLLWLLLGAADNDS